MILKALVKIFGTKQPGAEPPAPEPDSFAELQRQNEERRARQLADNKAAKEARRADALRRANEFEAQRAQWDTTLTVAGQQERWKALEALLTSHPGETREIRREGIECVRGNQTLMRRHDEGDSTIDVAVLHALNVQIGVKVFGLTEQEIRDQEKPA